MVDKNEAQKLYEFLKYVYYIENIAQSEMYNTQKLYTDMVNQEFDELRERLRSLDLQLDVELGDFVVSL